MRGAFRLGGLEADGSRRVRCCLSGGWWRVDGLSEEMEMEGGWKVGV